MSAAGTTWVGVKPTHRRQGIMRRMMTGHLRQAVDRGDVLAALWASEATIYGRFGYGAAVDMQRLTLGTEGLTTWRVDAPPPADSIRLVSLEDAIEVIDPIYEATRIRRAGMHRRSADWWRFQALSTRTSCMSGAEGKHVAVATVEGRDVAYAIYGLGEFSVTGQSRAQVIVTEIAGVDAASEVAMWRYLASHDLTAGVVARRRPVDDVLPLVIEDSRRIERRVTDALYVRVLDLQAALRARTFGDSAGFTMRVHDGMFDINDGTWRVEVAPEGVSVEAVADTTADIELDVRELSMLFMGDVNIADLARAARVVVHNPDVLHQINAAFRTTEAGWAPEVW